jgi:transcriptional regulator with XRE-family HTH domain
MGMKGPHQTDVVVGRNIRLRRLEKRMSQTDLGGRLDLTFQQVQKYEKGANRVGASRLKQIADVLEVPVHLLFDGAGEDVPASESLLSLISDAKALRLARAFARIENSALRRSVVEMVESIADRKRGPDGANGSR